MTFTLTKLTSIKSVPEFRIYTERLGIDLPIDESLIHGEQSPIFSPIQWGTRRIGNRIAIHPMEGWDGTNSGGTS
ncbi:MAG TPA: NADH:flavin oxidoreductase, partial [Pirellula sp.]|nr:NADH:flavin oxidoreductase [Pirellula sp.]